MLAISFAVVKTTSLYSAFCRYWQSIYWMSSLQHHTSSKSGYWSDPLGLCYCNNSKPYLVHISTISSKQLYLSLHRLSTVDEHQDLYTSYSQFIQHCTHTPKTVVNMLGILWKVEHLHYNKFIWPYSWSIALSALKPKIYLTLGIWCRLGLGFKGCILVIHNFKRNA